MDTFSRHLLSNNITKESVSNDYSSAIKNEDKSQQIPTENIKSIQE
jgi:hypothetical protein